MIKERPILFSAPMIRAILDGSKTQTRRVVKPQPMEDDGAIYGGRMHGPELYEPVAYDKHGEMIPGPEIFGIYTDDGDWGIKCPYGQPGDQLWVREAWRTYASLDNTPPRNIAVGAGVQYEALGTNLPNDKGDYLLGMGKLRPGMFMPRWVSRIQLEIVSVRVERLNDCSEADAIAEGVSMEPTHIRRQDTMGRVAYQKLWESINGAGSWAANPWVWVVEFRRIKP